MKNTRAWLVEVTGFVWEQVVSLLGLKSAWKILLALAGPIISVIYNWYSKSWSLSSTDLLGIIGIGAIVDLVLLAVFVAIAFMRAPGEIYRRQLDIEAGLRAKIAILETARKPGLSEAAKDLLLNASSGPGGDIFARGKSVEAGGNVLADMSDMKKLRTYQEAIEELVKLGYAQDENGSGEVFALRNAGIDRAEQLRKVMI